MSQHGVPLGLLLWRKIRALGVQSVMGVPGDMNLELLDYMKSVDGLRWVGNANELNAAYAADAYCRIKGCPGVLVTTMGVGELSALNGIAGAYTEQVKVIHIVGTTSTTAQRNRLMIHHSLGPFPDHKVYEKISQHVRAAHCWLDNLTTAERDIDRVFHDCHEKSLPVYIFVPMDMVNLLVLPSSTPSFHRAPIVDYADEAAAVATITSMIYESRMPVVIVDALVARHNVIDIARKLVHLLQFPTFSTSMGKSIIHETHPYFHGIYNGQVSRPGVCHSVETESDLVIDLGPILSDSNTGGFTRKIPEGNLISIHPRCVKIGNSTYKHAGLASILGALLREIDTSKLPRPDFPDLPEILPAKDAGSVTITQSWIWRRIGSFLRPGDILIAESGTAQFGLPDAKLPENVTYLTQVYYGSIGYSVPACLGACLARAEQSREGRVILVVGDGSLQLTVQEIGTMIKLDLRNIIIIIINNKGYTIERAIHGPEECKNMSFWNHLKMLEFLGAKNGKTCSRTVRTKKEFEDVVCLPGYTCPDSIQVLEICLDVMDLPWQLEAQIALINAQSEETQI
ncbi:pyruvate decarboxylase [Melanomma pulvis-pyrius CBS 109.77]|uniref:Pyruvate decarboxylase n=1 Tax=Melanomma pulvis-pyrius CBS 109.77 TaxID=1314802 RepID=A0A6A6XJI7_9PLEO|nr:pyruvate decarboxylase [Melanomma pulvis-pyrius CBS 109.77]